MAQDPSDPGFVYLIGPDGEAGKALNAVIEDAVSSIGLKALAWYDEPGPGTVTVRLVERLKAATVVLADLRGANPNVYYEVGIAHAFGRPVAVFVDLDEDARFDLHEVRALKVRTQNDGIANGAALRQDIKEAVQAAVAEGPVTAVEFAELRAEVPRLHARIRDLERNLGNLDARGPTADLWRDLALTGRLPALRESDIRVGLTVVHTNFGSGRIVAHTALGSPPLGITVDFAVGRHGLVVPDPDLYLATVRAIDRPAPQHESGPPEI